MEKQSRQPGLYSPSFEHDNCGIGAVVSIKGIKTHQTVSDALSIVENLEHRAGKDAEGKTGDGVGILLQISHKFFKKAVKPLGIQIGDEREYGVGMFFFPQDELKRNQAKKMFEIIVEKEGLEQSENMAEEIVDKLTASGVADYVDVTAYSKYVMLNVSGGILFNSGKSELTSEARSLLDKVADALIEYDDNVITIEGHTDSVPINTSLFPNNMMLSLYRAYSVFDFFVSEKGFSDQTMSSSGRGDAVPIATNDTPEGRAQNRRVEIKVYNSINS